MRKITFSADEDLIDRARFAARARRTTLNAAFREWLQRYCSNSRGGADFDALMRQLRHVRSSRSYIQNEMNNR